MKMKVAKRTRYLLEGYVASRKSAVLIPWRGTAERALFQYLDVDPATIRIMPQVTATDRNGEEIHRFPALVQGIDSEYFVALRPSGALPHSLAQICHAAWDANLEIRLFDRKRLLADPCLAAVRRLRRSRRQQAEDIVVSRLRAYPGAWPVRLAELARYLGSETAVDRLLLSGHLRGDLLSGLSPDSLVYPQRHGSMP